MPSALIVGATRGLGAALVKEYASRDATAVYATTRSGRAPEGFPDSVKWLTNIDLNKSDVADSITRRLEGAHPIDVVVISAGHFVLEDFTKEKGPNWNEEVNMYTTSAVAPVFIVHGLAHAGLLVGAGLTTPGSRIILVSSEAGSIALRHAKEGGGLYGHHASKAALNMAGKLLALDLADRRVIVSIVHPGFMRTELTKSVGFDAHWDEGGAVTPDVAAKSLVEWAEKLDMSKSGQYWAPRGPNDIGMAETVLGKDLPTPLQLPW